MNEFLLTALRWIWLPILAAAVAAGWWTEPYWQPQVREWIAALKPAAAEGEPGHGEHGHDEHDHAPVDSVELTEQGRKNIGLELGKVELRGFDRTVSVPGMVVERPGRSSIEIVAPVTGIVTRIESLEGQAVSPGELLFEVRLTHEEIVQSQADFLKAAEELDVIRREVERLKGVVGEGAVAGKVLLERQYEMQRQEAILRALRQALVLHGLLPQQVDDIQKTRNLLALLKVVVPAPADPAAPPRYQVQHLSTEIGQHVEAGQRLAVLTDHSHLFIQGNAFEQDMAEIHKAHAEQAPLDAQFESKAAARATLPGLKILYIASEVDAAARTFQFFVPLANELLPAKSPEQQKFLNWRYKPGQRVNLLVRVEHWDDRIVLPIEAVAQDGPETYVFVPNGKQFIRRAVHVQYRDPQWAVIANDGVLFPGDVVALRGANQLQLAIKAKSGGAIDPHAGHNH